MANIDLYIQAVTEDSDPCDVCEQIKLALIEVTEVDGAGTCYICVDCMQKVMDEYQSVRKAWSIPDINR